MKTLIAAVIALSATTASADICGYDEAQVRDYPGYASTGPVYDRGENLFTAQRDYDANVTYHIRINKETCERSAIAINLPEDRDEVVAEPVLEDGRTRKVTRFFGDPSNSDKAGDRRRVVTNRVVLDGEVTHHVTRTFHKDANGNTMLVVDNHVRERSFRIRANGERIRKDYVEEGMRTVAGTGNWVTR